MHSGHALRAYAGIRVDIEQSYRRTAPGISASWRVSNIESNLLLLGLCVTAGRRALCCPFAPWIALYRRQSACDLGHLASIHWTRYCYELCDYHCSAVQQSKLRENKIIVLSRFTIRQHAHSLLYTELSNTCLSAWKYTGQ